MGKPAPLLPISFKLIVNGRLCEYEPKPDITAYEVALLNKFITVVSGIPTDPKDRDDYINKHGLSRHFV